MDGSDEVLRNGLALLERGDFAGGITDLKRYLESEPEDAGAWLALGTAYEAIQHLGDAAAALKESVALDDTDADARFAYGRVLRKLKKPDDAAFQLLQATKLAPDDARAFVELGTLFYDKRLWDKAERFLNEAIRIDSSKARARYALGLVFEAKKDPAAAIANYREAVSIDPRFGDAWAALGDTLAAIGELEAAAEAFSGLLRVERTNERAAKNREVLLHALDEMRKRRLLGRTERDLESSALVQEGQLKRKGKVPPGEGEHEVIRYLRPPVELFVGLAPDQTIATITLVFSDPERAARETDDAFRVTVLGEDGTSRTPNLATAATLTFLREALGAPLTECSKLYARLLAGESPILWGGATLAWRSLPLPDKPSEVRHGLSVQPARP